MRQGQIIIISVLTPFIIGAIVAEYRYRKYISRRATRAHIFDRSDFQIASAVFVSVVYVAIAFFCMIIAVWNIE